MTVPVLSAELGFLPILLFWAAMVFIGRTQQAKKKRELEQRRTADPGINAYLPPPPQARVPEPPPQPLGMMDELRRAMEELKRAELQTRAHDAAVPPPDVPPVRASVTHQAVRRMPDTTRRPIYVEHKPVDEGLGARDSGLGKSPTIPASAPLVPSPEPLAPRSPLAKFADGSPKSALILATIIGRPLSDG